MEEKKIKNIRKKLQLRQTQKLNKKKVLCPPEFFFCCVEKNVLYVQTEKNVKKNEDFYLQHQDMKKENLSDGKKMKRKTICK